MIDLHTHTNESDGTLTPAELIDAAARAGLRSLAITDHDTFTGYDLAGESARQAGLDLICGIELSSRDKKKGIHILGYFLSSPPAEGFVNWLRSLVGRRRERNGELAERLAQLGVNVTLAEADALGRTVTGRVHFARVMMSKGYVASVQEAFDKYLAEDAPAYVAVQDPSVEEAVTRLRNAGGLPVVAHLGRYGFSDPAIEERFVVRLKDAGLAGIEVVHTDHDSADMRRYSELAQKYNLLPSGGSDYHGAVKPGVKLGHGNNGLVPIPSDWLERMRAAVQAS